VSGVSVRLPGAFVLKPHLKLRLAETANRLNVEHRTSNIERRILMALRFIDFETSQSQNFEG
jgi:flagellar basal body-associated protein FliL